MDADAQGSSLLPRSQMGDVWFRPSGSELEDTPSLGGSWSLSLFISNRYIYIYGLIASQGLDDILKTRWKY